MLLLVCLHIFINIQYVHVSVFIYTSILTCFYTQLKSGMLKISFLIKAKCHRVRTYTHTEKDQFSVLHLLIHCPDGCHS